MDEECREKIVSEDYVDFIWVSDVEIEELRERYPDVCIQNINDYFVVFYANADYMSRYALEYDYDVFPALYTLLQTESLEASNILQLQNQPVLQLKGQGVILGFIDTGIDYTNNCFRDLSGNSRILEIWDQTVQTGMTPLDIHYGSIYTREEINAALQQENPFSLVPVRDESGHGTRLAAIAGGSLDEETGWTGAAPLADLAIVKLKPAKNYLRQYFAVPQDADAYQANDIMLGIRYLNDLALREKKPLVICLGLGTNMGGHSGTSPLSSYLNQISVRAGRCVVTAGGNEANQGHHYYGTMSSEQAYQDVELRVGENEYGLMMEFWSNTPDVFSISLFSPSGEEVPRVTAGMKSLRFEFLFENTVVYINFQSIDPYSGEQLIAIRMFAPSPGIWKIRVFGDTVVTGNYNIWLPVTGFLSAQTVFFNPNPNITLTEPANTEIPITVGAYQPRNESIYTDSSRGFTRKGRIKPDITAPGVQVSTFASGNRFTTMTGTSAAAAVTSGAAALLLEWGIVRQEQINLDTQGIKQLLIRGAKRDSAQSYPSRSWGWGILDLYAAFRQLGRF